MAKRSVNCSPRSFRPSKQEDKPTDNVERTAPVHRPRLPEEALLMSLDWMPVFAGDDLPGYRTIADAISQDVAERRLLPGMRMPTHRELAQRLGVSVGTITRAYAEARDRGVLSGEVGRGTFVSAGQRAAENKVSDLPIDLAVNKPVIFAARRELGKALLRVAEGSDAEHLLEYPRSASDDRARRAAQKLLEKAGLSAGAEQILITNGAQQALLIALSTLAQPQDLVVTEELNYTGIRRMAKFLRVRLQGVAVDELGMRPEAFEDVCRRERPAAVIVTPNVHNPTTATMTPGRRAAIADVATRFGVPIIEDDVCGPLISDPLPPLHSLAGQDSYYICGTSKCLSPGLRLGYLVTPRHMLGRATSALQATTWAVTALTVEIVTSWIEDGTADALIAAHRGEIALRQLYARQALAGFTCLTQPQSYHLWLKLPPDWRAHELVTACAAAGVSVSPSSAFAISPEYSPNAVRLSLGAERDIDRLKEGIDTVARTLASSPVTNLSLV